MRKLILFLLVLVAFKFSQAQKIPTVIINSTLKQFDTLIISSPPNYYRYKPSTENMPNPYKIMSNQLTKIDYYSDGFDLFKSKQDNMKVLKPNSINLALTYIPNGYPLDDNSFLSSKPKTKASLDSLVQGK
jgi:hypothetical protein